MRDGAENETLQCGDGVDSLSGGSGLDVFIFTRASDGPNAAADRITDFAAAFDHIDLSAMNGTLAFNGTGAFAADRPQARLVQGAIAQVLIDLNDNNIAEMKIVLAVNIAPKATNFAL